MSDFRYQIGKHNGIACLHVMIEIEPVNDGIAHTYIPLDDIARSAIDQGYVIYAMPDAALQILCESQGYTLPAKETE